VSTLVEYYDPGRNCEVFVVNGYLRAILTESEARMADDYVRFAMKKVAPIIWLAMPGHEGPSDERAEA